MAKHFLMSGMAVFTAITLTFAFPMAEQLIKDYYISVNKSHYIVRYDANWFDEIRHTFGRGDDAVVRDIGTGRTFNIRRTFGSNHADIEPLTKEDTDTMYEIWGGWSWARRPVVVYVGGYIFAGSLTNFPHAGVDSEPALATVNNRSGGYGRGLNFDAVKDNGVDGHMCLHFAGSTLHGSNRSNPAHQYAVARAIEYIKANY